MDVNILLVEDNPGDAAYVERALKKSPTNFLVTQVGWLNSAIQLGVARPPDICVLDLSLPDSQGIDTLVEFLKHCPDIPVVVMTGYNDLTTAMNAVRVGAQDYLIKGEVKPLLLERMIMMAIERKRVDDVRKRLLRASVAGLAEKGPGGVAELALVGSHLENLSTAFEAVVTYLRKNAPKHLEHIQQIFESFNVNLTMSEVNQVLKSRDRKRTLSMRQLSDKEIEAIALRNGETSDSVPPDSHTAETTILDIIERREREA